MHTLTTQETIRKLTHYHVQNINDVESDVRQETKVTSGHTSTHAQHKLCNATSITHRLQMLVMAGANG